MSFLCGKTLDCLSVQLDLLSEDWGELVSVSPAATTSALGIEVSEELAILGE